MFMNVIHTNVFTLPNHSIESYRNVNANRTTNHIDTAKMLREWQNEMDWFRFRKMYYSIVCRKKKTIDSYQYGLAFAE